MSTETTIDNKLFKISDQDDIKVLTTTKKIPMGFQHSRFKKKNYNTNYRTNTFNTHVAPVVRSLHMPQKLRKARKPYWFQQTPFGIRRGINEEELRLLGSSIWVQRCKSIIIDEVLSADFEIIPNDPKDFSSETRRLINIVNTFFKAMNREGESLKEVLRPFMNDVLDIGFGIMVKGFHKSAYTNISAQKENQQTIFESPFPQTFNWSYVAPKVREGLLRSVETHDAASFYKQPDSFGNTVGWWQYMSDGIPEFFSKREMVEFHGYKLSYSPYGLSPVETIKNMVNVLTKSVENMEDYMENGAIPPGYMALSEISESEFELFESRWQSTIAGNPSDIPLLSSYSGKIEFKPLVINTADIKQLDTIEVYKKIVMSAFHVTPNEMGETDAVNKSSAEQQEAVQKRTAVFPFLDKFNIMINNFIVKEFDPYSRIKFKWIRPKSIDEEQKEINLWNTKMQMGIAVPNDYKKMKGEPIVAWGNVPFSMPLWAGMAQQVDPTLFGFREKEDQGKAKLDFAQRQTMYLLEQMQYEINNNQNATPTMIAVLTRLRMLSEGLNLSGTLSLPPSSIIETENVIDAVTRNNEYRTTGELFNEAYSQYKKKDLITEKGIGSVIRFFQRNKERLAVGALSENIFERNFKKATKPMEQGFFEALKFTLKRWSNRLTKIFGALPQNVLKQPPTKVVSRILSEASKQMKPKELSEMVQETLIDAYRMGSSMNNHAEVVLDGASIKFEQADPFAIDWLNNRTLILADNFINQYSNKISHKITEAMDRGLSIPDTVDLLKTVIPYNIRVGETQEAWRKRVKSFDSKLKEVARTEIIMASNRGRLMQLKNMGATHWKYHAFKDERNINESPLLIAGKKVTCRGLHDKTDVYPLDDTTFLPPIHPNCRCSIHGVYKPTEKSIGKANPQGAVMGGDGSGGTPISNVKQHPSAMKTPALVRALGGLEGSKPTPANLTRRQEIEGELASRKKKGEDTSGKKKKVKQNKNKVGKKEKPTKPKLPPKLLQEAKEIALKEEEINILEKEILLERLEEVVKLEHEDTDRDFHLMDIEYDNSSREDKLQYGWDRLGNAMDVNKELSMKTIDSAKVDTLVPVKIVTDAEAMKHNKEEAKYVPFHMIKGRQCIDCKHYITKSGMCHVVAGRINKSGHSRYWTSPNIKE